MPKTAISNMRSCANATSPTSAPDSKLRSPIVCCTSLKKAVALFKAEYPDAKDLVVAGGVAANNYLRGRMQELAEKSGLEFSAPPLKFCTDNGVMIAWAGLERLQKGLTDNLDFKPRPRWPLDELAPAAPAPEE